MSALGHTSQPLPKPSPQLQLPAHSRGVAPQPRYPCHILSDLHLGHFASKIQDPEQLQALFKGAASVILAGDTSEAHIPSLAKKAHELRSQLLSLLQAQNIQVIELPGNHDPAIAPHTHALLAEGQILVLHGDALFPYGIPWGRELKQSLAKLEQVSQAFGAPEQLQAEDYLSRANAWVRAMNPPEKTQFTSLSHRIHHYRKLLFPPQRVFYMADAVLSAGKRACCLAERFFPQTRFIIHGHTHLGSVLTHGGRTAINTGAFVRIAAPRLVIVKQDSLSVYPVTQQGSDFFPRKQTHCWQLSERINKIPLAQR